MQQVIQQDQFFPNSLHSTSPSYEVRLASKDELKAVFKLRYDIFYTEMGAEDTENNALGLDTDRYDEICDHLIVLNRDQLIGTYRLLPFQRLSGLDLDPYSESEFYLGKIRADFGQDILELGRSCVHPNFRTGMVPRLLWAGIAQYMLNHNIRVLLGCVSVHGFSNEDALKFGNSLRDRGYWHPEYNAQVKDKFVTRHLPKPESNILTLFPEPKKETTLLMPPLMKGYFNLGAQLAGGPAHDSQFHCHDYLIFLDREQINPKYYNSLVKPLLEKKIISLS